LLYCMLPVLTVLILRNPFVGLVLYTGVNIVRPEMFFWGGYQGAIVFKTFIGAAMLSFILKPESRLFSAFSSCEFWLIAWIWLALLVSIRLSPYPPNALAYTYANEVLKLGVLAWLIYGLLSTEQRIVRYEQFILGCFTLLALWGIEQHFRGNERLEGLGGSATTDSNGVAAVLILAFPLALNLALHGAAKRQQWLGWLSSAAIFLAVIATQSRGGLLGLFVATAVFFLYTRKKKKMLVVAGLLVALASVFTSDAYMERMSTIVADEEERDFSAGSRLVLWQAGMLIFSDYPLTGTGFLSFPVAKQEYRDKVQNADEALLEYSFRGYKVGHNTYIQALSEGGLFLFVPYALLIAGCLWSNRSLRRQCQDRNDHNLVLLLNGIEAGIIGNCFSILFINALTAEFLPVQIMVSRAIRDTLRKSPAG